MITALFPRALRQADAVIDEAERIQRQVQHFRDVPASVDLFCREPVPGQDQFERRAGSAEGFRRTGVSAGVLQAQLCVFFKFTVDSVPFSDDIRIESHMLRLSRRL